MPVVPLADAESVLDRLTPRVLFSDLDGTLVGRGGSLLAGLDGTPTIAAARALLDAHNAHLRIVLISGRTWDRLREVGRVLGTRDAIAELGTVVVIDDKPELIWGETPRDVADTPAAALQQTGALACLLDSFDGRIELHEPPERRQGTILLRGQITVDEANAALRKESFGWARVYDNGRFNRPFSHLGPDRTHALHLTPVGVTKATGVAAYLAHLGLDEHHAAAIGDAPSDLELLGAVGAVFVVANGAWATDAIAHRPDPVILTPHSAGDGWAEAVTALLSHRAP
jgi:HAD superfamily hydrolase (TIGR01484 family)